MSTDEIRRAGSPYGKKEHAAYASEREKYWRNRRALCGRSVEDIARGPFFPGRPYSCKDCSRKFHEMMED